MPKKKSPVATADLQHLPVYLIGIELCSLLRIKSKTLARMREQKAIEYIRKGKKFVYSRKAVMDYLEKRTVKAA